MMSWIRCVTLFTVWSVVSPGWAETPNFDKGLLKRSTDPVWAEPQSEQATRATPTANSLDVSDRHNSIAVQSNWQRPGWLQSIIDFFQDVFEIIVHLWLYLVLVGAILVIGTILYFLFRDSWTTSSSHRQKRSRSLAHEAAKIQDLPFEVEASRIGLLEQAMRFRALGDYSSAVIYLFSHVLVELDSARCIRLERGKTNRRYLRELRGKETLEDFAEQLVLAFEYSFFGKHVLTQTAFESLWATLPEFKKNIADHQAAMSRSDAAGVR